MVVDIECLVADMTDHKIVDNFVDILLDYSVEEVLVGLHYDINLHLD